MSLRRRTIPSILNGVSRQPPILRAADQNEDELNTWSTMAAGLGKRPPAEYVAKISSSFSSDVFIHYINRDTTERYCVVIDAGVVRVFDVQDGTEKTVNAPGGYGYLASGTDFRAVTVADYTFIVNTSQAVALDAQGADTTAQNDYYRWLNRNLANSIGSPAGVFGAGITAQYPPNLSGGVYQGEVASIEKLPETAPDGHIYKITGSIETGFVSYYVRRSGAVWDETVAPNQVNALLTSTMPHALISEADGTFTFAPFSWAPRRVGDEDSNPPPTFVGKKLSDVFFYQNRLGFCVDENLVFSCAGDFGNFWRNTVLDYISTDMIDHAVATTSVSLLKFAVPFNDGIMAFADQTQFSIKNGEDGLTPESLSIAPVTNYEINQNVRPVNIGQEVYFCGDVSGGSLVWEYTRIEQGESLIAAEISAHVPNLIPAKLRQLVAAPNAKALFGIAPDGSVYTYQFYWNGNEKIQSAWRKWTLSGEVLAAQHMDDNLFVVLRRSDGIYLTSLDLSEGAKPDDQDEQVFLDMRMNETGGYDPSFNETTFTLPYAPDQSSFRIIRRAGTSGVVGSVVDPSTYSWNSPTSVSVPGDEKFVTVGEVYRTHVTFSRQFALDYQGRPVTTGRLQLRTFTINYTDTAFFKTEVSSYGPAMAPEIEEVVPEFLPEFTGRTVGEDYLYDNMPVLKTGSYSFQIYGEAAVCTITLSNETHVGSTFVSAEWEGFYFNRASQ